MEYSDQVFSKNGFKELIANFRNPGEKLSNVNHLTSTICDTSVSLINFVDDSYQYTISKDGKWDVPKIPSGQSICRHTLENNELLVIYDTTADSRTRDLPYLEEQAVYFYAGVPIPNSQGSSFGTLCVIDDKSRGLTKSQEYALKTIADQLQFRIESFLYRKKYKRISKLLEQKNILFYEIHHRIKNNLADICGMLQIQQFESENRALREILSLVESRISAVAKLHEVLHESDELVHANLKKYVDRLLTTIVQTSPKKNFPATFRVNVDAIRLSIGQSFSLGLILNELISNTMRHAFNGRQDGDILIEIVEDQEGLIQVRYHDNGVGLDLSGDSLPDYGNLGFKLIDLLVKQLGGDISVNSREGTTFLLKFMNESKLSRDKDRDASLV